MAKYLVWSDKRKDARQKEKIKAIQKGIKAYPDGYLGEQSLDVLYRLFAKNIQYPYSEKMFDQNFIFTRPNLISFIDTKNRRGTNKNELSGTFQWDDKVISILINDGKVIGNQSSHNWLGKPETCIYYTKTDGVASKRIRTVEELPTDVIWAISGVGLKDYNPEVEGFCRNHFNNWVYDYSDVLRTTGHTTIGFLNDGTILGGYVYGNGAKVRDIMISKMKCIDAIILDGGSVASIFNSLVKKNINMRQSNVIKF